MSCGRPLPVCQLQMWELASLTSAKGPVSSSAKTCACTTPPRLFHVNKVWILRRKSTQMKTHRILNCLQIQPVEVECGQGPQQRVLTACWRPTESVLLRSGERRMADTAAVCRKVTVTRKYFKINLLLAVFLSLFSSSFLISLFSKCLFRNR